MLLVNQQLTGNKREVTGYYQDFLVGNRKLLVLKYNTLVNDNKYKIAAKGGGRECAQHTP